MSAGGGQGEEQKGEAEAGAGAITARGNSAASNEMSERSPSDDSGAGLAGPDTGAGVGLHLVGEEIPAKGTRTTSIAMVVPAAALFGLN